MTKAARREQLLEAALAAFLRGGYHGTHVEQIVAEAGVARGTFYLHFESKHAVFAALVDRMLGIFEDARPPQPDPELRGRAEAAALLEASYRTVLETFWTHRRLLRLLLEEAVGVEKGFAQRLERHYAEWHRRIRETIALFAQHGLVANGLDHDVAADLVLGMVDRVVRRHLLGSRKPDIERLVRTLVDFELGALAGGTAR